MATFSAGEILARRRSATFCAISLWTANRSFKSRSYSSAQTCASVRASINWAFMCSHAPVLRTLPSNTWDTPELITDLARVLFTAISHHAGPANNLEIGNLGQLGQKVVLDAVGKGGVLSVITQIFKWKHCDSSCCGRRNRSLFQTITPTAAIRASDNHDIPAAVGFRCSHFFPRAKNSGTPGSDWFVLKPAFQIFGQRESGRVTALRIFLETLQANRGKIAIYFCVPQTRWARLGFQQ